MKKKTFILLLVILFVYLLLGFIIKYRLTEVKQNELYTIGKVTKISHVQGTRSVDFTYTLEGRIYNESSMDFTDNIYYIGTKYFVIVSSKNFEKAYILGDCPYDEKKHYVPSCGLNKIPDEKLQEVADKTFGEILNKPLVRLLPPYGVNP